MMRGPTHAAFGVLSWYLESAFVGFVPDPASAFIAALASQLPDIDAPNSWVGSLFRPLSKRIARFGRRTITHSFLGIAILGVISSPLLFINSLWYASLIAGYLSHPIADAMTKKGVLLLWPSRRVVVLPLNENYRIQTGSAQEALFAFFVIALIYPAHLFAEKGLLGTTRYILADLDMTFREYREIALQNEVFLDGRFYVHETNELFEGSLLIIDIIDGGYLVKLNDEIVSIGENERFDLFALSARLRAGNPIKEIHLSLELGKTRLSFLKGFINPNIEHYITGELELKEPITLLETGRFSPITGSQTIVMHSARWRDIESFQNFRVEFGKVTIRHRLRDNETLTLDPSISTGSIELEFEVSSIEDLLVAEGDVVELGQVIARKPEIKKTLENQMELEVLKSQLETMQQAVFLGLKSRSEYAVLESKIAALQQDLMVFEEQRLLKSPVPGLIASLFVDGSGELLHVQLAIRKEE